MSTVSDDEFTLEQVEALIETRSKRVTYVQYPRKKRYAKIFVDEKYTGFAKFLECVTLYIAKYTSGSSGLIYHEKTFHMKVKCYPNTQKSTQPPLEFFVKSKLTKEEKEEGSRAKDILSFQFVKGHGIRNWIDVIADVCHRKKEKLTSKEILPSDTTVGTYIGKIHKEMKKDLKGELKRIDCIYATCDH